MPLALRLSEGLGPNAQLVNRLYARREFVSTDGWRWYMTSKQDGDCQDAADAIAQLYSELQREHADHAQTVADAATVARENTAMRAALKLAMPALERGCDSLRAEAERYHVDMRGARPEKHRAYEDDYERAKTAWRAVVAALGA